MRFLLYDRVTLLDRGRRIAGVRSFSLADEFLRAHFERAPVVPCTVLLESMIQLLGWAVIHAHDFDLSAIVCLVEGVRIRKVRIEPGFEAEIGGEILSTSAEDSLGRAWLDVEGVRLAEVDRVIYRHFRGMEREDLRRLFESRCNGPVAHAPRPQEHP